MPECFDIDNSWTLASEWRFLFKGPVYKNEQPLNASFCILSITDSFRQRSIISIHCYDSQFHSFTINVSANRHTEQNPLIQYYLLNARLECPQINVCLNFSWKLVMVKIRCFNRLQPGGSRLPYFTSHSWSNILVFVISFSTFIY